MKSIGLSEFVRICQVHEREDWGGYRVCTDGVYINIPDADVYLTPDEFAAITQHPTGDPLQPLLAFPCTVEDLKSFLEREAIGITVEHDDLVGHKRHVAGCDKADDVPLRPIQRSQVQNSAILSELRRNGFEPEKLPKNEPGKRGVKAKMWEVLQHDKKIFASRKVFDIAWQRLRDCDDIAD